MTDTAPSDKSSRDGSEAARLEDVLKDLRDEESGETISVNEILEALAHRSFGPLLLIPGLIAVTPVVGALPGVSYTMAVLALIISVQFALSKPKLWTPGFIRRQTMDRHSFDRGVAKARPVIKWIDRLVLKRFTIAFHEPMPKLIAALCVAVSVLMIVYASVPGGIVIPAVSLILLGLALTTHDGLVLLLGIMASIATLAGTYWVVQMVL